MDKKIIYSRNTKCRFDEPKAELSLTSPLLKKAYELASYHHRGQERKGGEPYLTHPIGVALLLQESGYKEDVIACGLLHDVLEDTGCEYEEMIRVVGRRVTNLVAHVTERDKAKPWKIRKAQYLAGLKKSPKASLAVACADKIDNLKSLIQGLKKSGKSFSQQFGQNMANKVQNYVRVYKVIKSKYPNCPMLSEYSSLLNDFSLFLKKGVFE